MWFPPLSTFLWYICWFIWCLWNETNSIMMDDLFDACMKLVCKCFIGTFVSILNRGYCSIFVPFKKKKQYKWFVYLTVADHHGSRGGYPGPSSKINPTFKALFLTPAGWEHQSLKQDDRVACVIHKFYVYLRALSLWTGPAQHVGYPSQLDGLNATGAHDGGDLAESSFLFWIWFWYQDNTSKSKFESILFCLME